MGDQMIKHRYYMGRHLVRIQHQSRGKSIITHLESGYVGNSRCGYKEVNAGDTDITLNRLLWKHKKRDKKDSEYIQLKLIPFFPITSRNNRNNRNNRKKRN
jgi:hypothetical protein